MSQPLTKDPYAKFRFPKFDAEPSPASKIEISPLESLAYIINVACHRLEPDLKAVWDEMIGRDSLTPEISKSGMLLTSFDIKKLCGEYKKARGKENYVRVLKDHLEKEDMDVFSAKLINNQPRFRMPSSGLLCEFLSQFDTTQMLIQKFENLINEMQFSFLWSLLDEIKLHLIFKKDVKRVEKFIQLMKMSKKVHRFKITYYLRQISRAVTLNTKNSKIVIKSLNLQHNENLFTTSKCPEILVSLAKSDYLQSALVDSGAMANICPYQVFEQLNLDTSKIVKLSHNLSLVGTTGSFNDAIIGMFTCTIYCLLKKQTHNGDRVFGHSRITFLVTKKEVGLKRLILGMPWQKSCKAVLDMSYPMTVVARLKCDSTEKRCSLSLIHI